MALPELSSREILQAVAEYDQLGQDQFLEKYGFGPARSYWLVIDGKTYDSKAIVGAATASMLRSEGHCESPHCTGEPQDITDAGHPILEVDHVQDLAQGGPDHPEQMIALCPNCHAIKTRGRTREQLRQELFTVAMQRHQAILRRDP